LARDILDAIHHSEKVVPVLMKIVEVEEGDDVIVKLLARVKHKLIDSFIPFLMVIRST